MTTILWLIPVLPLAGFLVNGLLRPPRSIAPWIGCAGPVVSFALSIVAFLQRGDLLHREIFTWIAAGDVHLSFGLTVDALSGIMILVVTGVGSLIHVYSVAYMEEDESVARYFAYLNLFMFAMLVLVLADNVVLMFLGWEGVGLCSYLLIGFWFKDLKNADAGKKAFITNRVGDFGFLIGIFCLWMAFGRLDFAGMDPRQAVDGTWLGAAAAFLFLGACGKSAQLPLHVWLPDAMAGPTPVSALIHAATMVTAGVYMIGRMHRVYSAAPEFLGVIAWIGALTAFLGAATAVAQNDIKKILAYSTISQLGFMFAGMASADFTTGMFHVVTHAFFKALLFLGAGAVIHAHHGEQDIRKMGGLAGKLPLLTAFFCAGGLALAGMPFSAGFVSKDEILTAVFQRRFTLQWALLVVSALLTAFYTGRMIMIVFFGKPAKEQDLHRPGILMMAPLGILAVLSLAGGLLLQGPLEGALDGFFGNEPAHEGVHSSAHSTNITISVAIFLLGFLGAAWIYGKARGWLGRFVEGAGRMPLRLASNKFYIDELYEYAIIIPIRVAATVVWFVVDRVFIDGLLVGGAGRLMFGLGGLFRRVHTGSVNAGVIAMAVGALAAVAALAYTLLPVLR